LCAVSIGVTTMHELASSDGADVGQIKQSIKANFSVDAFPGETFTGEISQLRLNAQTTQNVVTYSAVIDVANPELKLRPGMTANITIPVARASDVLTVPNAALRFKPNLSDQEQQALRQKMEERRNQRQAERQGSGAGGQGSAGQDQQPNAQAQQSGKPRDGQGQPAQGQSNQPNTGASGDGQRRQGQIVWVLVGDKQIEPRFVRTGLTNGRVTEVSGDLKEGDIIIIGQNDASGNK